MLADGGRRGNVFSSPEHEVLMLTYCDWSLSLVHCALCGVNNLL